MTLNVTMSVILRYFTEFDSVRDALRKVVENIPKFFYNRNVVQSL